MTLSSLKRAVSSRLAVRLILAVIVLISAVSLILTLFFMYRQKSLLTEELFKRTSSLAHNLAYNCSEILTQKDQSRLYTLIKGVDNEPDILGVLVAGIDGAVLAKTETTLGEKTINVQKESLWQNKEPWFSQKTSKSLRLTAPIDIDAPVIHVDSPLLPSPNSSDIWGNIYKLAGHQPIFNHAGDEILCTVAGMFIPQYTDNLRFGLASISISSKKVRFLMDGSNGCWSKTGRYMAYNTGLNPVNLSVLDNVMGKAAIVVRDINVNHPAPCFTYDDRHIISAIAPDNREDRLFRIPREGGKAEQLTFHTGQHWFPNCSNDGKWILYSELNFRTLYIYDTRKKKSSRLFPNLQDVHVCGCFSPDGTRICYIRGKRTYEGDWDVYIADFPVDVKKPLSEQYGRRLTYTGNKKWWIDWSPDGSLITYGQLMRQQSTYDVWIVSAKGDAPPENLTAAVETHKKRLGYVVLDVSLASVNRAIAGSNKVALTLFLILTGIGICCAIVMVRNIVRPVKTLADAAGKVAEGDLDLQVPVSRNDEIGVLAESFNRMTGRLKTSIEDIETRNRDLEKAYHELESLDSAKDDFLSLVSHELRTPLGSMLLHAEMLLKRQVTTREKQAHYHETIVNQCKRLTRLVNDILDLSKIEAGRMELHIQPFSLRELISDIYSVLSVSVHKKNLRFDYETVPVDIWLKGDRDKIAELLTNIITNAIKFTPEGGSIIVSLSTDGITGTIAVRDTGIGMRQEDIPKVFDRFKQLEKVDHHTEGSGLGMTISKSIVELHGGTIWIESAEGKGTTVFFTLPVTERPQEPEGLPAKSTSLHSGIKEGSKTGQKSPLLLIVDDERSYREAIADCVRNHGYGAMEASNGSEALRLAEEAQPSLIILDVMMPDLSGLDVCRMLRKKPATKKIPIVMLSARGQVKEREKGLAAGADRYITKPFDDDDLILTIGELTGGDV
jgi:signal transduction histidine kinase/ActR/RegA family two-component response regulator